MSKLEDFLASLSDSELAIFIVYRFDDFIGSSKRKIKDEVASRKLSTKNIADLYNEGLLKNKDFADFKCPRCNSDRFHIETDHETRGVKYYSYEVAVDTKRCRLCGYNHDKRKPKNIFDAIKLRFRNNKIVRIPKQSEKVFRSLEY